MMESKWFDGWVLGLGSASCAALGRAILGFRNSGFDGRVLSADPPQVVGRTDDLFDVSFAETAPTVRW